MPRAMDFPEDHIWHSIDIFCVRNDEQVSWPIEVTGHSTVPWRGGRRGQKLAANPHRESGSMLRDMIEVK